LTYSKKRFKDLGYNVIIVEGYNIKDNPEIKPNQICYRNLLDKIFPLVKDTKIGFLVAEDDAYLQDILTPKYLLSRLKNSKYLTNIIRVGYQKKLTQSGKTYPLGYYLVGTQLLWFPKKLYKTIIEDMMKKRPQHLDGYLSKLKDINVQILDEQIQKKKKYVLELEHISSTTGKKRSGLII
jgi:hypothetical protein